MDKEQLEGLELGLPYTKEEAVEHGYKILLETSRTLYETINFKMSDLIMLSDYLERAPFFGDGLIEMEEDKKFLRVMRERLDDIDLDLRIYDRWVRDYIRSVGTLRDGEVDYGTRPMRLSVDRQSIANRRAKEWLDSEIAKEWMKDNDD